MRKIIVISLFLFLLLKVQSQDWDLFPLNQRSYYKIITSNQSPVYSEIFNKDSINQINDTNFFYFNSKQPVNNCYSRNEVQKFIKNFGPSNLELDSGFIYHDTSYFLYRNNPTKIYFKFLPHAKPNDSWKLTDSKITFTCDSISRMSIFNEPDSVKYFSINKLNPDTNLSKLTFILSKHHGLIEFAPFIQLLFYQPYNINKVKLIGYENGAIKRGLYFPGFEGFFHLSTGDVLYWQYKYTSNEIPPKLISHLYKDSIITSIKTNDSVVYNVVRFNDNLKNYKYVFKKSDYSGYLTTNSKSGVFTSGEPYFSKPVKNRKYYWEPLSFVNNDTFSSLSFGWAGYLFDTISCNVSSISDNGYFFQIDSRFGLFSYCSDGYVFFEVSECRTIVGAIVDGDKWGITNISTQIEETEKNSVEIFPNPFNDRIYIKNIVNQPLHYQITDITGKIVMQDILKDAYIETDDLKEGVYNLLIYNNYLGISKTIVKIN